MVNIYVLFIIIQDLQYFTQKKTPNMFFFHKMRAVIHIVCHSEVLFPCPDTYDTAPTIVV